jgi:hypothetical protein
MFKYLCLFCGALLALPAWGDASVGHALDAAAQAMYRPMPADAVRRLSAEEWARYILDNIYRAKAYHRFDEGRQSSQAAVDAMELAVGAAPPATLVRIWSALDAHFIAALNADVNPDMTVRKATLDGQRSLTVYALSWEDVSGVLEDYPRYRLAATRALLQLATSGDYDACRVFQGMYDLDADPFAGEPGVTWETVGGVGVWRNARFAPLGKRNVNVALPSAVLTGCQHIHGGTEAYRIQVEGHFRRLAQNVPPAGGSTP